MKLFVLLRKDMPAIQKAVQAGHAVAEYLKKHTSTSWSNGTLVLLGVDSVEELHGWQENLDGAGIDSASFYEPDMASCTGVSFVLNAKEKDHRRFKRRMDKHLRLLTL